MSEPLLVVEGLRREFTMGPSRIEVLRGVDLTLAAGELVAMVGQSGAGKSTLLHVLGLLDRPCDGRVRLNSEDVWDLSTGRRAALRNREIGFIFQFYHLLPELNALENVLMPAMIAETRLGYRSKRGEYRDRALAVLERFGLQERLRHRPSRLSGGERQRVAIARALLQNPKLLLADEPTGNLDSATGEQVLEMLLEERARRGVGMILVTHDERLAARCERTLTMRDGRVVDED